MQCLDKTSINNQMDVNKRDPVAKAYPSRLAANQIKVAKRREANSFRLQTVLSSKPPILATPLLRSLCSTKTMPKRDQRLKFGLWYISRAFYIRRNRLPPQEQTVKEPMSGLLEKAMYGTQDAPANSQAVWMRSSERNEMLLSSIRRRMVHLSSSSYTEMIFLHVLINEDLTI